MCKVIFKLPLILMLFFLSACGTQATPIPLPEGPERDAITNDSNLFVQNVLIGIAQQDYALFANDFDETMLTAMDSKSFEQIGSIYSSLGEPESVKLLNVIEAGEYFAVRYEVTYAKKTIVVRLVVDTNNPRKVSGLWFE